MSTAAGVKNVKVEKETSAGEHVAVEAKQPVTAPAGSAAAPAAAAGGKAHAETEATGIEDFEELCMDVTYPCAPKTIFDLWYRDDDFVAGLWDQLGFMGASGP